MLQETLQQHAAAFRNKTENYLTYHHCTDNNHSLDISNTKIVDQNKCERPQRVLEVCTVNKRVHHIIDISDFPKYIVL